MSHHPSKRAKPRGQSSQAVPELSLRAGQSTSGNCAIRWKRRASDSSIGLGRKGSVRVGLRTIARSGGGIAHDRRDLDGRNSKALLAASAKMTSVVFPTWEQNYVPIC